MAQAKHEVGMVDSGIKSLVWRSEYKLIVLYERKRELGISINLVKILQELEVDGAIDWDRAINILSAIS